MIRAVCRSRGKGERLVCFLFFVLWLFPLFTLSAGQSPEDAFRFGDDLQPLACSPGASATGENLSFCILADQEGNGVMPAVFLVDGDGQRHEIWRDYDRGFHPWKIAVTELDGDPQPEIALGVRKTTRRDRLPRQRLFIFDWSGQSLVAKWLGSWPVEDLRNFCFLSPSNQDNTALLVTVENDSSKRVIRRYKWNSFGFTECAPAGCAASGDAELLNRLLRETNDYEE